MIVIADTTPLNYLILDIPTAVARLQQTTFRISPRPLNALLDRYKS